MDKPHSVAVTFGRFNLLHVGHLDLFRQMAGQANRVIIGVSSAPANLPIQARVEIIAKALEDDDMDVEIRDGHQPFEVFSTCPENTIVFLGEDQVKLARAVTNTLGFEHQVIERLASSTQIRQLIDAEEWDLLAKIVPGNVIRDVINMHLFKATRNAEV